MVVKEQWWSLGAEGGEVETWQEGPGKGFEGTSLEASRGHSSGHTSQSCGHPLQFSYPPPASRSQASENLICAPALASSDLLP